MFARFDLLEMLAICIAKVGYPPQFLPFKTDFRSPKSGHTRARRNLNERQVSGKKNEPGNDRFVGGCSRAGLGRGYRKLIATFEKPAVPDSTLLWTFFSRLIAAAQFPQAGE